MRSLFTISHSRSIAHSETDKRRAGCARARRLSARESPRGGRRRAVRRASTTSLAEPPIPHCYGLLRAKWSGGVVVKLGAGHRDVRIRVEEEHRRLALDLGVQ